MIEDHGAEDHDAIDDDAAEDHPSPDQPDPPGAPPGRPGSHERARVPERVTAVTAGQALEAMGDLARQVYDAVCEESVGWTTTQLHEQALIAQAIVNSIGAVRSVRIAQYAHTQARTHERVGIADRGRAEHVLEFVPDELAPSFRWGPRQADHQVEDALAAVEQTPALLDAAGRGELDPWRIGLVTGELQDATAATCRKVEQDLLAEGITDWTGSRTRRRARAAVHRHEPAAEKKVARKRARERINVFCDPGQEPGTTDWHATLWTKDAHTAYAAVEELARQMHHATTTGKTLGQCRADAMCDLILGHATVTTQATLLVPVHPGDTDNGSGSGVDADQAGGQQGHASRRDAFGMPTGDQDESVPETRDPATADPSTGSSGRHRVSTHQELEEVTEQWLLGHDDAIQDVDVPGFGYLRKSTVIAILHDLGTRLTASLVDQTTGALLGTSCATYRPAARVRTQVELRDRHCRFPTCQRPARWCDADHVTRWPEGPTSLENLQLLCRHHHRVKHETGWRVTMDADGTCHWKDRTGREYITRPGIVDVIADTHTLPAIPGAA